jgi:hypothetical protein
MEREDYISRETEERMMTKILEEMGTLALVFYKRAKDTKLLEEKNFKALNVNALCLNFTFHLDIDRFVQDIVDMIVKGLQSFEESTIP